MEKKQDPELKEFVRGNVPLVFMFQPTQYQIVSPDKHRQWEKDLIEKVGVKVTACQPQPKLETWSMCYGANDWDDCDML